MLTRETCPSKVEDATLDYIYLLDDIAPSLHQFAFSLRKLRSAYTGYCLQIRRASDNTTRNIGFVNNYVDLNDISNFCGTSAGYITVWYDQTANGATVAQSTVANQPMFYDGNIFLYTFSLSGSAVIAPYYDGANDHLTFYSQPTINTYSLYANLRISASDFSSGYGGVLSDNSGTGDIFHNASGYSWQPGFAYLVVYPKGSNNLYVQAYVHENSSLSVTGYQNRTLGNTITTSTVSLIRKGIMGYWAGKPLGGWLPEIMAFNEVHTSTVRNNVQSNMIKFTNEFSQPYKPVDFAPNALVAFSLRKIKTTYSGNAIRVRRSSDNTELNIGFDGEGNLNIEQLINFCGVSNGFVTQWYNQTGGYALTQPSAGYQPQIVFNGSVLYDNGKPAVYWEKNRGVHMYTSGNISVSTNICSVFVNNTDIDVPLLSSMYLARLGNIAATGFYGMIPRFDGAAFDWQKYDSGFFGNGYQSGTTPRLITNNFDPGPLYRGFQTIVISRLGGANFVVRNGSEFIPYRINNVGALPSYNSQLYIGSVNESYQGTIQEIIYYQYQMLLADANVINNELNNYYNAY